MVVPCLRCHLHGHKQTETAQHGSINLLLFEYIFIEQVADSSNTQANPDGKGIERTGIGIIALARLDRCLVQVKNNSQTCHEEQEEDNPELLHALVHHAVLSADALVHLPYQADDAKQKWQAVEDVTSLVLTKFGGQIALVAQTQVVEEWYASNPVTMLQFAMSLYIILTTGKIPHEVAPVHEVHLIGPEEVEVLHHGGYLYGLALTNIVYGNVLAFDTSHPFFVVTLVAFGMHTREEHVVGIDILLLVVDDFITVWFFLRFLFHTLVLWRTLYKRRHIILSLYFHLHWRRIGLAIEQGAVAILVASQITSQSEDILGRVLIHGSVGLGTDNNYCIGRIANHNHQQTEQGSVHQSGRNPVDAILGIVQHEVQDNHCQHSHHNTADTVSVERDTQHANAGYEGQVHAETALLRGRFSDGPKHCGNEDENVNNKACIEGHAKLVYKQQLEPAAHFYDTRNDAIQHYGYEYETAQQSHQAALDIGIGVSLEVPYQHKCRQTEQVQQVYANTETGKIGYEDKPAVGTRLVSIVLPLENKPEYNGGEEAGVGINLALYGRVPECVGESVCQSTCHSSQLNGQSLPPGLYLSVFTNKLACQMANAPEQEHYTCC